MGKNPTPKADALREMREARFKSAKWAPTDVPTLRDKVAAIPVKKPPKKPKEEAPL
jgi:hypothetical protein